MKVVIIEDESQAVIALEQEIKTNCPSLITAGSASNINDAYNLIIKEKPVLVFLDIQLKDGNGFDLLSKFDSYDFKIIFTTAYGEYALDAIKVSALDYLLKPIDSEELIAAVDKVTKYTFEHAQTQLQNFVKNQHLNPLLKKIALQTSKGISLYRISNIIKLHSEGNYTVLYLADSKKIVVAKTLKEFEELLSNLGFIRIHHSHIINLSHLKSYENRDGGFVILEDKTTIPVSKRRKSQLLYRLNNLHL